MPAIEFNIHNGIGLLTVNRPEVRNALNLQAMADFAAAIDQAHATTELRALIVTGSGKAFISGRVISAPEAHRLGIVTHLTPPDEALSSAMMIADSLAEYEPGAIRAYKRILRAAQSSIAEAQAVERAEFPKLWAAETHHSAVERFLGKE
ncbi:MAG TPA: enoyl-CoA hydratase/isomerase family protein [Anaerolineales bacterium]|nr:enoyl-CoA hydratase/isomerase family protein [Anaerolineales bacterium]